MKFLKYRWLYFLISGLALVISFYSLMKWRLKPSIDFQGGNIWEISFEGEVSQEEWLAFIKNREGAWEVQKTDKESWLIRSKHTSIEEKQILEREIEEKFSFFKELRFESMEPSLGKDLLTKTLIGIVLALAITLLYVSFRFKNKSFGVCAVLAMLHDSFILLGVFSLLGHFMGVEVDSLFVTAFLTTLSFSVHDTVVVYDRIRELSRLHPKLSLKEIADLAITQTIVRSLNNSMTIIFVLLAVFLLGGETTRWFSFALLVGAIAGTYSSTFTAVPLLIVWERVFKKKAN